MKRSLLTAMVMATWTVLLLGGAFRPQGLNPNRPPRPEAGYPAPDLEVVGPDMAPIKLSDLRGKVVFLNFWASWCGPCRVEMPEIQRLHENLPEGATILAVNLTAQETGPDAPLAYLQGHGFTFSVALDPAGRAGEVYRVISLPTSLFISPDGMVTARITGPLSYRAMTAYLTGAASARAVKPERVSPFDGEVLRRLHPGAHLPEALAVGPAVLPTRALAWLVGTGLAYVLAGSWARRAGLEAEPTRDLILNLAVGGVLGAKFVAVILDPAAYAGSPGLLLTVPQDPFTLPGAAAGALALGAWGLRHRPDRFALIDQAAPAILLGLAIGAAGSARPGSWAFFPALLIAGLLAAWFRPRLASDPPPGHAAAGALVATALVLALADLARPASRMGGVTGLQLAAALVGTAAWLWQRRASGC